jgi:SWI/SNF-related matrix-associated actin-dependent regulator of chromatin subfamily A member 5
LAIVRNLGWWLTRHRDWETVVEKCKDQPADINVKKNAVPDTVVDEEAEKKWLSEMEKVESSVFEGKKLAREKGKLMANNRDVAAEWNRADRRIGKNTTVMVDGFAISKESMNCGDWEAVPTMAGKDPRLADPKRAKRGPINPQSHCQVCLDGGELHCCQACPRAYHYNCLDREYKSKAKGWQFNCPQHSCNDCEQKTSDAGGMLYRCRWCERAYCEDCLEWEKTKLVGDNLPEYELLAYPQMVQAFYIQCHACSEHFTENPADKAICDEMAAQVAEEHRIRLEHSSRSGSLTDATTIETPGVGTPILIEDDEVPVGRKRKAEDVKPKISFKRGRLRV